MLILPALVILLGNVLLLAMKPAVEVRRGLVPSTFFAHGIRSAAPLITLEFRFHLHSSRLQKLRGNAFGLRGNFVPAGVALAPQSPLKCDSFTTTEGQKKIGGGLRQRGDFCVMKTLLFMYTDRKSTRLNSSH